MTLAEIRRQVESCSRLGRIRIPAVRLLLGMYPDSTLELVAPLRLYTPPEVEESPTFTSVTT